MTMSPFSLILGLLPTLSPATALCSPFTHTYGKEAGGVGGSHRQQAWRWGKKKGNGKAVCRRRKRQEAKAKWPSGAPPPVPKCLLRVS